MATVTSQERFRTDKGVFDEFTNRNLFKLKSEGIIDELVSPLKVGKESNVFIAKKSGKGVIVKIYRVQNADFKRMFEYIKQDRRYEFLRNKRRDIIFSWTQREYKNLLRAQRSKVRSPKPLAWKMNIVVMEMIGNPEAAPPLKDLHPKDPELFLKDIIKQMALLYKGGLIHGDLSSFNILNDNDKPVLIDYSQGTLTKTPNAEELLIRDIKNVLQFFKKFGIKEDPEKIYQMITK